jgi:hypothetical protein
MIMNDNTSWIIIDEREATGSIDTWNEYLCVGRTDDPNNFEIAICGYEMVGEIPSDWFDEDGQPLPEYSDGTGCLEVPEYYEYRYAGQIVRTKLTGHDGEYLLGELVYDETYGSPITVHAEYLAELSLALKNLGWVAADQGVLINSIQQAFAAKTI